MNLNDGNGQELAKREEGQVQQVFGKSAGEAVRGNEETGSDSLNLRINFMSYKLMRKSSGFSLRGRYV